MKNIIIIVTVIFSIHLNATQLEKKFDEKAYNNVQAAFDEKLNKFYVHNITNALIESHIATIKQHKEQKEQELATKKQQLTVKKSWKPLLLNALGGISAVVALSSAAVLISEILYAVRIIQWETMDNLVDIVGYPGLFIQRFTISPMALKLFNLYENGSLSLYKTALGIFSLDMVHITVFVKIAKYLFIKASHYTNEIKEIEKIIARDNKMIEALEKIKKQDHQ